MALSQNHHQLKEIKIKPQTKQLENESFSIYLFQKIINNT